MRTLVVLWITLGLATRLFAQAATESQDHTYTISTAQAWADTGLDLQTGDTLQLSTTPVTSSGPDRHAVSGTAVCDPNGSKETAAQAKELPLPAASEGALIARLQPQSFPVLIGAGTELHITEPSHLFLGINTAGEPVCKGSFEVRVHRIQGASAAVSGSPTSIPRSTQTQAVAAGSSTAKTPPASENSSPAGKTEAQPKSRSEELKSQVATAGRIFVTGQFGTGKPDTATPGTSSAASAGSAAPGGSATPVLKVSDSPLDPELRKEIDGLPRRVNDQLKNLGDMVNFVIVGSEKDIQAALESANWHVADTSSQNAVLKAVLQTYEKKDYLQMPMSTLYLFGRAQDFGYEQAEPIAMVASRHHFRIWKAPFTWQGHEVWVGAGTHDIGFAKDKRNGSVTHKIDPSVDAERENVGASLQKSGKAKSLNYYLPPSPVQEAKNATGDVYHSDGRMVVIFLQ